MKQIYLVLDKNCNLACNFCIRDYSTNSSLLIENIDMALIEIKKLFPNVNIILTGGEPTLIQNFMEIIEKTNNFFHNITINSNGTTNFFKKEEFVAFVKDNKIKIQFSIDGYEKYHDQIRGNGTYKKILENIKFCSKFKNISISISSTVSSKNFLKNFNELYNDLKKFNLRWSIKRVSYSGGADITKYDYLENNDWNAIVEFIKTTDTNKIINIFKTYDFELLDNLNDKVLYNLEKNIIKNCGSGIHKLYIYPNMDVLACTCYEFFPSGNLLENSLKEILNSDNHLKIINQTIDNEICNNCRYKKLCNGGCLGAGFYTYKKHNIPDIKCPKIYKRYKKGGILYD